MTKHSELPWKVGEKNNSGEFGFESKIGEYFIPIKLSEANASFIVLAVNNHEKLVEVLKMANILLLQTDIPQEKNDCMIKIQQAIQSAEEER